MAGYTRTAAIAGVEGDTSIGTEITKWSLNIEIEDLDATNELSGGNEEYIPGLVSIQSGTADSNVPLGPAGAKLGVTFVMPDATSLTADIIITDVKPNAPVQDEVTWTADFIGTIAGDEESMKAIKKAVAAQKAADAAKLQAALAAKTA